MKQLIRDYKSCYYKLEFLLYLLERFILFRPPRKTTLYNTVLYDGMTWNDFIVDGLMMIYAKLHLTSKEYRFYHGLEDE